MNIVQQYARYIKNNPKGYWFKRKPYGWGWTPVTWQGWCVLLVFVALMVVNAIRIDSAEHSVSDVLIHVIPQTAILALVLIGVCFKTGEKPRWQWGFPAEDQK